MAIVQIREMVQNQQNQMTKVLLALRQFNKSGNQVCSETGQLDGENAGIIENCLMEIEAMPVPRLDFSQS